ncbi:MAG: dTMP kinase [Candidatus Desulfofervidus auxilii]|nr:dTMP kinase [Candidatus Desulfofervidus auxilii]
MSLFITFEGIEGCGKTTQLNLLAKWLKERNKNIYITYEPGGTDLGKNIRKILLSPNLSISAEAELFLYLADRAEHIKKVILPALAEKEIVLCDRYHDSTLAYQGYGRGIDLEFLWFCFSTFKFPLPHITFLLDCPVEIGLKRIRKKKLDRIEKENLTFHQRVREGFLKLAKAEPGRIKVIDATLPKDEIQIQIRKWIKDYGI